MKHYLALKSFWQTCSRKWHTSIIIHETYFRRWSYPPSWIKGSLQKYLMQSLVRVSRNVFSAVELLVEEMKSWGDPKKIVHLPLSSNFPFSPIDKEKMKSEQKLHNDELIFTLFGGGNALCRAAFYVNDLDRYFYQHNIPIRWLLLGGMSHELFDLSCPVISKGRLPPDDLSAWLQLTDIFIAPHSCGLAASRGTLMAALQHGLPVVGTKGYMTAPFLTRIPGLILESGTRNFSEAVIKLSTDPQLRQSLGDRNRQYFNENFCWDTLARTLIESIAEE